MYVTIIMVINEIIKIKNIKKYIIHIFCYQKNIKNKNKNELFKYLKKYHCIHYFLFYSLQKIICIYVFHIYLTISQKNVK